MFLEFLLPKTSKTRFPPRSVAGWSIGSRQFRAGIVFLEFLAAENLKNTIPAPLCRGMGHLVPPIPSGNRVFGAENLKNTIPAPLCRGMGHSERESCFWSF